MQPNSHVIKHDHFKIAPRSQKPSQKPSNLCLTQATGGANRIQACSWTTSAGYTRTSFVLKVTLLLVSHPAMTLMWFTLRSITKIQTQHSNHLLPLLEPNGHGLHFQKERWPYVLKHLLVILHDIHCQPNSCLHSLWKERCTMSLMRQSKLSAYYEVVLVGTAQHCSLIHQELWNLSLQYFCLKEGEYCWVHFSSKHRFEGLGIRPSCNMSMVKSVAIKWSTTNNVPAEFYKLISLFHLKVIAIIMNVSYKIDEKVLIVMAYIQATLRIIPCIIGPKENWEPWMHDNLQVKQICMQLLCYFLWNWVHAIISSGGDFKCQWELSTPKDSGQPEVYVGKPLQTWHDSGHHLLRDRNISNILVDELHELKGANFWWQLLSLSSECAIPCFYNLGCQSF